MTKLVLININEEIEIDEKYGVVTEGNIQDIRDLDNVSGSRSKSLFITSNDDVNRIFNGIFNINAQTLLFDQTVKQECELWHNEELIIKGFFQIVNIQYVDRNQYIYEIWVFDEQINFFLEIEENLLIGNEDPSKDIDFSQYNHEWTADNILDSWNRDSDILPYYYSFFNQTRANTFEVEDAKPGFYVRNIIEQIFYKYDYQLQSEFLNSELFKEIFIPFSTDGDLPSVSEDVIESRKFRAEDSCNKQIRKKGGTGVPFAGNFPNFMQWELNIPGGTSFIDEAQRRIIMPFNILDFENTANIFNTGNCANVTISTPWSDLGLIQNLNGEHDIHFNMTADIDIINTTSAAALLRNTIEDPNSLDKFVVKVELIRVGTALPAFIEEGTSSGNPPEFYVEYERTFAFDAPLNVPFSDNVNTPIQIQTVFENIRLYESQKYFVAISLNKMRYTSAGDLVLGVGMDFQVDSAEIFNVPIVNSVQEGDMLELNDWLPENMKQKDLLKSIFKMFNLKMMPSTTQERTLIIEPRDDFYTSGDIINCNEEDDFYIIDKPSRYQLVTDLQAKDIIFKYADDSDSDDDDMGKTRLLKYKNKYKREYGEQRILFDNENLRDTRIIDIDFASTRTIFSDTIWQPNTPFVKYITGDIKASIPANLPRILFKNVLPNSFPYADGPGGRLFRKFNNISTTDGTNNGIPFELVPLEEYGTGTHYREDPFNPTFDLNFGRVKELLFKPTYITDNNLYTGFWINEISEIDEQKMFTAYFYISNARYKQLKYNDILYFDHNDYSSYYIINKISEYNVKTGECKLELLTFNPQLRFNREIPIVDGTDETIFNPNPSRNGVNIGEGNISRTDGDAGNFVIGNDNNTLRGGFTIGNNNFTNKNGTTIGDNNVNYSDSNLKIIGNDNNFVEEHTEDTIAIGNNMDDDDIVEGAVNIGDVNVTGDFTVDGVSIPALSKTTTITTNLTITTESLILCNHSSAITISLPSPSDGQQIIIKDISGNANRDFITVDGGTIDGESGYSIRQDYESITLLSDGSDWYLI